MCRVPTHAFIFSRHWTMRLNSCRWTELSGGLRRCWRFKFLCPVKQLILCFLQLFFLLLLLMQPAIPRELALPIYIDWKALSSLTGIIAVGCASTKSLLSPAVLRSMHPGRVQLVSCSNEDRISVISVRVASDKNKDEPKLGYGVFVSQGKN